MSSQDDGQLRVEMVRVVCHGAVIDAQGNERTYARTNADALAQGHYVVIWVSSGDERHFNQSARFYGPYDLALMAQLKIAEHVGAYTGYRGFAPIGLGGHRALEQAAETVI